MNRPSAQAAELAEITVEVTSNGRIRGLWNDALALAELGRCTVQRASFVEFSTRRQHWYVREGQPAGWLRRVLQAISGRRLGHILHVACSREQALRWEARHFAPGGPGWNCLKAGRHSSRMS